VNVARASLEELLLDYEDFLRHRHLPQWASDSSEAIAVRNVPRNFKKDSPDRSNLTDLTDQERWALYARWLEHADPAVRANALICLINQANYLLDQQIASLEAQFIEEGGYSELLATARLAHRRKKDPATPSDQPNQIPPCPLCGKPTVLRTAKSGKNEGKSFWGCTAYPDCKGIVPI
jgi:restriction system protein